MQVNKQINQNILVLKEQSDAKILFSSLNLKDSLVVGLFSIGMIALSWFIASPSYRHSSKIGVIKTDCERIKNTKGDYINCKIFRSGASKFPQNTSIEIRGVSGAKLYVYKGTSKLPSTFRIEFFLLITDNIFKYDFDTEAESKSTFESINNFLNSKEVSFSNSYDRYAYDNSFYNNFLLFLVVFFNLIGLLGLLPVISSPFYYDKLLLNKLEMQLTYTNRAFLDVKVKQYAFTDITKVDLLPDSPDKNNSISFVPRLTVNYEDEYILGDIKDRQTALEFVNNLNKFIGLPEEDAVLKSEDESC